MRNKQALFLLAGMIFWLFAYNAWHFIGTSLYYYGTALIVLVSSIIINHNAKEGFPKLISSIFLFISLNNFIDELFFNPQTVDINEYVMSLIYITYLCKTHYTKYSKD